MKTQFERRSSYGRKYAQPSGGVCPKLSYPAARGDPDVGLYLEQVTRYVNQSITGCGLSPITASMVSNYVKQKIIPGPEKKAYGAESIAYLIFVSCIKSVVAMDDIRALIGIQHETYDLPTAYHYFCEEFENLIRYVFGASDHLASVGQDESDEKELLRSALLSVTHKLYLDAYLRLLRQDAERAQKETEETQ